MKKEQGSLDYVKMEEGVLNFWQQKVFYFPKKQHLQSRKCVFFVVLKSKFWAKNLAKSKK